MPLLDSIFGQGVKAVTDIISQFHMSPEDKAKLEQATAQLQFQQDQLASNERVELAKVQATLETSEADDQAKIQIADSSSNDPFVRRARPTFIYIMCSAIACSLIVFPIINAISHRGLIPMVIPTEYLNLFGVLMIGLTGARTIEKLKGKD